MINIKNCIWLGVLLWMGGDQTTNYYRDSVWLQALMAGSGESLVFSTQNWNFEVMHGNFEIWESFVSYVTKKNFGFQANAETVEVIGKVSQILVWNTQDWTWTNIEKISNKTPGLVLNFSF